MTVAARRLHLAQPTVSNALARLREYFGDPLLVRSGRGMRPTPKARHLMGPLRDALTAIERTIAGSATIRALDERPHLQDRDNGLRKHGHAAESARRPGTQRAQSAHRDNRAGWHKALRRAPPRGG